jgi:adenylosuccinate synthase
MSMTAVIGTQWGDEGKGKIVDYYANNVDYVVRFQGGNNAGHTIKNKNEVYKLHIIPSGVIQGKIGVIGNGCVVDPEVLIEELSALEARGIQPNILLSNRAHIIMSYHKLLDGAAERLLKDDKIGTTKRGIGPCYSDKIARNGIRVGDLTDKKRLQSRLANIIPIKQRLLDAYGIKETLDSKQLTEKYFGLGKKLSPFISDTQQELQKALREGKPILLEGAQGAMLDVDFGTYPYTTSSHVIVGGASIGAGIPPSSIKEVVGVMKAYTTRVGEGPFPTELDDATGKHLQEKGHEFGTTTSRPRRCGWLDLVVVNHACQLSGITKIAITKLDVLNELQTINICTGYLLDGKTIDYIPSCNDELMRCQPVYHKCNGWKSDLNNPQSLSDLPAETKDYLSFIESYLSIPIQIVSTGPDREETFEVRT